MEVAKTHVNGSEINQSTARISNSNEEIIRLKGNKFHDELICYLKLTCMDTNRNHKQIHPHSQGDSHHMNLHTHVSQNYFKFIAFETTLNGKSLPSSGIGTP